MWFYVSTVLNCTQMERSAVCRSKSYTFAGGRALVVVAETNFCISQITKLVRLFATVFFIFLLLFLIVLDVLRNFCVTWSIKQLNYDLMMVKFEVFLIRNFPFFHMRRLFGT